MAEQFLQTQTVLERIFPEERARIVRLCAGMTGSPQVAEDLAQETLLEAWRSRDRLVEPGGTSRWLSAIARNVCLRWMRAQGRAAAHIEEDQEGGAEPDELPAETPDLEIELERDELADLLDRAMAQLPPNTRSALVQRYVLELSQREIASRLGLSEGAVEARLQRGKLTLHRLLLSDYHAEAAAFGLAGAQPSSWVETRLWCPTCGQHHLYGTLPRDTGQFELHCPKCSWLPNAWFAQSTMLPIFNEVKGYRATLKRFEAYMSDLYAARLYQNTLPCQRCGRPSPIHFELPPSVYVTPGMGRRGAYIRCQECGSSSYTDIYGIALNTPAAQRFWRAHARVRTLPEREVVSGERPALLVRFESLASTAALEVVLSADRYAVLEVREPAASAPEESSI